MPPVAATYYRYAPAPEIRAICAVPFGSGGGLLAPAAFVSSAALLVSGTLSPTAVSGGLFPGFAGAASDGASGAWLLGFGGPVTRLSAAGAVSSLSTPPLTSFTGLASVSGVPWGVDASGSIYTRSGSAFVSGAGTFGVPARTLTARGATLYALLPSSSGVGTFDTGALTSGIIVAPMAVPAALGVSSGGLIAVGGWDQASIASGFFATAFDPANPSTILAGVSAAASGSLTVWTNDASGNWSLSQTLSGVGAPRKVAWLPTGGQIFAASPSSNQLTVANYALGILTLAQTISVSGAAALALTTDSLNGLICQPSLNQVTALTLSGSAWVTSGSVGIGSPQAALALSSTSIAIGCSSGVALLSLAGGAWSVSSVIPMSFTPGALATDGSGTIFGAGTSGASGFVATSGISASFAGSTSGVIWQQGQLAVADQTNSLLRVFQFFNGALTQRTSISAPAGVSGIAANGQLVLANGASAAWQYRFGAPWTLQAERFGKVSLYNGSVWTTTNLQAGHIPQAVAFSPSGTLSVATLANELFTIAASGGIVSSGAITLFPGQAAGTPLGISSLTWLAGNLLATSSLNQSVVRLSP